MFNPAQLRRCIAACLGALLAPLPSLAQSPFQPQLPSTLILDIDSNIYATQEALNLVMEARKHDPSFSPQRNRDMAAQLYAQAIAAQPGAKGNAPIASRIAQMYAFLLDPANNVAPNHELAKNWWNQCLAFSDETQVQWAEAQMGLVSLAVIERDHATVRERCARILAMDVQKLELAHWKDWSRASPEAQAAELTRQRDDLTRIQKIATERLAELARNVAPPPRPATTRPATTASAPTTPPPVAPASSRAN